MIGTAYGGGIFWTKNRGLFTLALLAGLFLAAWIVLDLTEGRLRVAGAAAPGAADLDFPRGEVEIVPGRQIPLPGAAGEAGRTYALALSGQIDGTPAITRTVFRFRLTYDGIPGTREYQVDGNFWNTHLSRVGTRTVVAGWFDLLKPEKSSRELGLLVSAGPEEGTTGRIWLERIAWTPDGGQPQALRTWRRVAQEGTLFFAGCWLAAAAVASFSFRNGEFGRLALLLPAAFVGWRLLFHRGTLEPATLGTYSYLARMLDGVPPPGTELDSPLFFWVVRLCDVTWDADFVLFAAVLSWIAFFTVGWAVLHEARLRPGWREVVALVALLGSSLFVGLPGCSGLLKHPGNADALVIVLASLALWHGRAGVRWPAAALAVLAHAPLAFGMLLAGGLVQIAASGDRWRAAWRLFFLLPWMAFGKLVQLVWSHAVGFGGADQRLDFLVHWGFRDMVHHVTSQWVLFVAGLHTWLWPFFLVLCAALWKTNRPVFRALLVAEGIALLLQFLATDFHRIFVTVEWPAFVIATGVALRGAPRPWRVALWGTAAFAAAGVLVAVGVLRLQ